MHFANTPATQRFLLHSYSVRFFDVRLQILQVCVENALLTIDAILEESGHHFGLTVLFRCRKSTDYILSVA